MDDHRGDVVGAEASQVTFDPDVLEALGAVTWLEDVTVDAGGDHHVGLERQVRVGLDRPGVEVLLGDVTVAVEPLAMGEGDLCALRPEAGEADPAVDVLSGVDHPAARCQLGDRHRWQLLDATDGWRGRFDVPIEAMVLDLYGRPRRPVGPGSAAAEIVDLAGDEVSAEDVARCRPPGPVGPDAGRRAVGEGDVQLRQESGGGAIVVDTAGDAVLAAPPPVAEQRTDDVVALHEQRGDVEGLDLQTRSIGGPAGCQLLVADPSTVHERLVEAVRRGAQHRGSHLAREVHRTGELVGGSLSGRDVVPLDGGDPSGGPGGHGSSSSFGRPGAL